VVYQASQPGEKVIRTRLDELVEKVRAEGITRQALVIVGRVLEVGPAELKLKSKLYDKDFEHGFRK
jgi:precorrin-4/cobalt-precorrin-4 C11-methyltransferase